jgi:hypothetical protein
MLGSTGCEVSSRRSLPRPSFVNFTALKTYYTFLETPVFVESGNDGKSYQIYCIDEKIGHLYNFIFNTGFTYPHFIVLKNMSIVP